MRKRKIEISQHMTDEEGANPCQLLASIENLQYRSTKNMNSSCFMEAPSDKIGQDIIIETRYRSLTEQSITEEATSEEKERLNSLRAVSIKLELDQDSPSNGIFQCQLPKRRRKRANGSELKDLIKKQKIRNIVKVFTQKLKRNNLLGNGREQNIFRQESEISIWSVEGLQLREEFERVFESLVLVLHIILIYFYTLSATFNLQLYTWAEVVERTALTLCITDFVLNLVTVKVVSGKRISLLSQIFTHYLSGQFIIDLIFITVLLSDMFLNAPLLGYLKLIILAKIPHCMERMEKLQMQIISNSYKEQYWSIIKVFLFNFCYAHLLAVILKCMADVNSGHNWIEAKGLTLSPWYQVYIWAYYWAVNIMLTVGFGDIIATNYQQALCLIFIQTVSCMALAYNINCIGNLIANIRAQEVQKSKKYKVLRSLTQKNSITNQLFMKIGNYIEESNNIKKKFNIEEENRFVQALPRIFRKDYLNQSNKSIFQHTYFFRNLAQKAIQSLAQAIQITITHPEQVILNSDNFLSIKILKEGSVGYCVRKSGCDFNGRIIDIVTVEEGNSPFLIGLEFITNRRPIYEVKSLVYSVTYSLGYEKLISSLRKSRGDYEYFCFMRDKNKHILDEFEILTCSQCKTNHTRFGCSKLHYIPIVQHIINRSLYREKVGRTERKQMDRLGFKKQNALSQYKRVGQISKSRSSIGSTYKRNKVFIIKQLLSNIERYDSEYTQGSKTFLDYQLVFMNNAAESIKQQLTNFLRRQNEEDQVWTICIDTMQNYKGYFPEDNPCNLSNKFENQQAQFIVQQSSQMFHQLKMKFSQARKQQHKDSPFNSMSNIQPEKTHVQNNYSCDFSQKIDSD